MALPKLLGHHTVLFTFSQIVSLHAVINVGVSNLPLSGAACEHLTRLGAVVSRVRTSTTHTQRIDDAAPG